MVILSTFFGLILAKVEPFSSQPVGLKANIDVNLPLNEVKYDFKN